MSNNKIVFGNTTLVDLTRDTATIDKVLQGKTFIDKSGTQRTGTMVLAGGASVSGTDLIIDGSVYIPPAWSSGADSEIIKALDLHYRGYINLKEYWHEGDERSIPLSNGTTEILRLKNSIHNGLFDVIPKYVWYKSTMGDITYITYDASTVRAWLNNTYYNYYPDTIKSIFKQFVNAEGVNEDYFSSPTKDEALNIGIKTVSDGTAITYWTGTIAKGSGSNAVWYIKPDGTSSASLAYTNSFYVLPIGVI